MQKSYILTLLFISFHSLFLAQTPCDATTGMAGIYPCDNYDLMSNIPISILATTDGTPEGSDIWGWTDPLNNNEYAIMATTNSTAFVDITNPVNPIFLGRIESTNNANNFWRDVKVYDNHAFIVADGVGNHGMQIFDLTILRDGPNPDLTYTSDPLDGNVITYTGDNGGLNIGSCHNIVINETAATAYLVGCGAANGGPIFIDISNPLSPITTGSYSASGYTHDAQVITYNGQDTNAEIAGVSSYVGREILVAANGATGGGTDKIVLIDVTDKNDPKFIQEVVYPQAGYAHQGWFTDDHRYFIMGDELDESGLGSNTTTFVFDMLDLDNPVLSSTYVAPFDAIDHNGYVKGNEFYLANYRAGMRVFDITNISNTNDANPSTTADNNNSMTEIGYFDTYPSSNSTAFNGAWSIYPYFQSGNIIISDIESGLFVVRESNTLSNPNFQLANNFTISPNPTTSNSIIKGTKENMINSVEIYNILGQKVFNKNNINNETFVLPVKNYRSGVYLIKINSRITKKLIVK